jgi:hypothetical protein
VSLPAQNDAPARARESIGAALFLQAANLIPYLVLVSLLEQQAAGEKDHGGNDHRLVEAGVNVVSRKQGARSLEDEPHS